jgi:hypothetical protein
MTPWQSKGPTSKLILNVLGTVARFERDLILECMRAGLAAARKRRARLGPVKWSPDVAPKLVGPEEGFPSLRAAVVYLVLVAPQRRKKVRPSCLDPLAKPADGRYSFEEPRRYP